MLADPVSKAGTHPLHAAGAYYCLDFSSVFTASVLLGLKGIESVFDLCAAPGGKSVLAAVFLSPSQLSANEVIGKRTGALITNLKRCKIPGVVVTRLDPRQLATLIPETQQCVMVDAPCSGQSLPARGSEAPGCFHPVTVKGNAGRQKRILAQAAKLVAPGGYLTYMTCTYSLEENEHILLWLLKHFPTFTTQVVPHLTEYQSKYTELPCYRLWPHQGLGAGGAVFLVRNTVEGAAQPMQPLPTVWEQDDHVTRRHI